MNPVSIALAASTLCQPVLLHLPGANLNSQPQNKFYQRDVGIFIAETLSPVRIPPDDLETSIDLGCLEDMPDELASAIRRTNSPLERVDPLKLRNVMGSAYLLGRNQRHQRIPLRLEDFKADNSYESWESKVIPVSRVKRLTRIIYESPPNYPTKVFVAVTHESTTGDRNAPVRESEIIIKRDNSHNWDFYSYDKSGELDVMSEFPAGKAPSPAACMSCHYSAHDRAFVPFSGTP